MQAVSSRTARAAEAMRYAEIAAPVSLILSYIRKQAKADDCGDDDDRAQELLENLFIEIRAQFARKNMILTTRYPIRKSTP